jgi:hypothetical protein
MKFKLITSLAVANLLALSSSSQGAAYLAGDLLMGVRATGGQGIGTTYVVNIGQASGYRDATTFGAVSVPGNFTQDLATIFGANWYARTDLQRGIAGTPSNSVTVGGDEAATMYASKSQTIPGDPGGAAPTIAGLAARTAVSTTMIGMQQGFAAYAASGNSSAGTIQLDTDSNDWRSYMASGGDSSRTTGNRDFGGFANIEGSVTQQLSLFRLNGPDNVGTFEGSFSLNQGGLTFIPEPTSSMLAALGVIGLAFRRRRSA